MKPMMIATHLWAWWKKGVGFENMEKNQPLLQKFVDLFVLHHPIKAPMESFWLNDEYKFLTIRFWAWCPSQYEKLRTMVKEINKWLEEYECPWNLWVYDEDDDDGYIEMTSIELHMTPRKPKLEK